MTRLASIGRALVSGLVFALLVALVGTAPVVGDEPAPKDDALDQLLQKLDESAKDKEKAKDHPAEPAPGEPKSEAKAAPTGDPQKTSGEVAPKDQALDSLLEKLGETKDRPEAQDERRGGPPMPGEDDKDKEKGPGDGSKPPKKAAADDLSDKDRPLDERLEELTGRRRKKKQDEEERSGPLGQVIKQMREVEQRLGKPDTGEETRKRQTEIVRNLEQLIEQLRNSSAQSKGQRRIRTVQQNGQNPGNQPDGQDNTGANARGAPNTKPARPESKHAFVNGKDEWGHLPPELRQEVDNVAREEMLSSREDLIRRYFLSLSKKSATRGEPTP